MRLPIALLLLACGTPPTLIDARHDAGIDLPDGAMADAGMNDAGMMDAGGCDDPLPPAPWVAIDTGGPAGETLSACITRVGSDTDDRLPDDQSYDVTTFGGPGDEQPVACAGAPMADGTWYYAANNQRFSCGQHVRLVDPDRTSCVIVEVADLGPNACVEEAGGRPIWDVSPLAAMHLFGVSSVGYSEHVEVIGAPVDNGNALGPCDASIANPSSFLRGFIGGPCDSPGDCPFTSGTCLTEAMGFPGGTCTQPCETSCPDEAGPNAFTACVDVMGTRQCLARCDYTLFDNGCRDGYGCVDNAHPTTGANRRVCLPLMCS